MVREGVIVLHASTAGSPSDPTPRARVKGVNGFEPLAQRPPQGWSRVTHRRSPGRAWSMISSNPGRSRGLGRGTWSGFPCSLGTPGNQSREPPPSTPHRAPDLHRHPRPAIAPVNDSIPSRNPSALPSGTVSTLSVQVGSRAGLEIALGRWDDPPLSRDCEPR